MTCSQSIDYIHSLLKFGIKPGLQRIEALCEILGNPQKNMKFVHVAGTNGKGSTSTIIANILQKAGYNVGLFTSPYVLDFRERIKYNGNMIEPDELASIVEKVKSAVDILNGRGEEPTEFEAITAAAFLYFQSKCCDFVVLEVGLGGRLDSTNVIDCPVVNVITSISIDHIAVLGSTLTEIAGEKCGTIKQGGTCVCYPEQFEESLTVIRKTCTQKQCELIIPEVKKIHNAFSSVDGTDFDYEQMHIHLPLDGEHMVKNCITAVEAVKVIKSKGFNVTEKSIIDGISSSVMPARLEIIRKNPLVILDGGHNEGCANAVAGFIKKYLHGKKITALISMMSDKDYDAYLRITAPYFTNIVAAYTNVPRALSASELCSAAEKYCKSCYYEDDSEKALKCAMDLTGQNDVLFVCGSFYFAGEIRDKLLKL